MIICLELCFFSLYKYLIYWNLLMFFEGESTSIILHAGYSLFKLLLHFFNKSVISLKQLETKAVDSFNVLINRNMDIEEVIII